MGYCTSRTSGIGCESIDRASRPPLSRRKPSFRALLRAFFLLNFAAHAGAQTAAEKLDDGLDDAKQYHPIFVRMNDQLIGRSGDFERFCQEHAADKRCALRKQVLETLHDKADESWKQVAKLVQGLDARGN